MNVMLRKVLELQLRMTREIMIQEDIEAVLQCSETRKTLPSPGPIMVKTPRECETKRLVMVSEGCECGPRNKPTIKMQSTTSSSVIDTTSHANRGCGPRSILGKTVNAVPMTNDNNVSEDRECGQRSNPTIKMQSKSSSSVIDVTAAIKLLQSGHGTAIMIVGELA